MLYLHHKINRKRKRFLFTNVYFTSTERKMWAEYESIAQKKGSDSQTFLNPDPFFLLFFATRHFVQNKIATALPSAIK